MSNFKVGQKVVCVEPTQDLVKGEIYTIECIAYCKCGKLNLGISEMPTDYYSAICDCGFEDRRVKLKSAYRFRLLDHQFAEDVLAEITKSVQQEELVSV